jgi:hypothetical protein
MRRNENTASKTTSRRMRRPRASPSLVPASRRDKAFAQPNDESQNLAPAPQGPAQSPYHLSHSKHPTIIKHIPPAITPRLPVSMAMLKLERCF